MKVPKLQSDEEMEILFPPHPEKDFEELEKDIIKNGCNKPLTVWRNILIDGHARFEICIKHNIRFLIKYVYFDTREEAIDFICTNQLMQFEWITTLLLMVTLGRYSNVNKTY